MRRKIFIFYDFFFLNYWTPSKDFVIGGRFDKYLNIGESVSLVTTVDYSSYDLDYNMFVINLSLAE